MRDKRIDFLRFVGLSSLILAHVGPPGWLFQLRNFTVPLLVMASAMILVQTTLKDTYLKYVWKRVKRLVFPAWLFLTFYFLFIWATGLAPQQLTGQNMWNNYSLSNAGGFMWIIRIFLLVALTAPFIYQIERKIQSNEKYIALLFLAYIVYEGLIYLLDLCPENIWTDFAVSFSGYALGYGIIFALGMRLGKLTSNELRLIGGFSFCVFAVMGSMYYHQEGHFIQTQQYKYPPSAYYLSYAIAASFVTWWCAKFICEWLRGIVWLEGIVFFIAQNTLWIYLWHTMFLLVTYRMTDQNFLVKYFVVYVLSVLTVLGQVTITKKFVLPGISSEALRKNIKILLTG